MTALSADEERERSVAAFRRRTQRLKGHAADEPKEKLVREVTIPETITIQELANRMAERGVDVIKLLMKQGHMAQINDVIDADTAQLLAEELGHTVKRVAESDVEEGLFDVADDPTALVPRPAVVTVMGHVDHGKTSLLDAIRSTEVAAGEAGGITQHIGAYQVTAPSGNKITFIDTPGHAAFTAMRARGAKVTDIVVLVVAADDGVMPQTVEAINHAKAAKVPMIVAINKIDRPDAKPERVRNELLQHEIQVEIAGRRGARRRSVGDQEAQYRPAARNDRAAVGNPRSQGQSEPSGRRHRDRGQARPRPRPGRHRAGATRHAAGRRPHRRRRRLGPGAGAGLRHRHRRSRRQVPRPRSRCWASAARPRPATAWPWSQSEARAREVTDYRARQRRDKLAARATGMRGSLEQMMSQLKTAGRKEFPLVIKADVQGSLEAIIGAIEKLGTSEVGARVIHSGVGGITESDVTLAEASGVPIIGFNVRAHKEAREAAERAGIEIRYYNIIYDLVDDVKKAMSGLLAPTIRETMLGNASILEIFKVSKVGNIAGCRVTDGVVERGANVRLIRDSVVVHEGKLSQLKRFKDDAREVVAGQECGMAFENYQDMKVGDVIECYRVETVQRSL